MPSPDAHVQSIEAAFDRYRERFRAITRRARQRFEEMDHTGMEEDVAERLDLYRTVLDQIEAHLREAMGEAVDDRARWSEMKRHYAEHVDGRDDWELARTFFSSLTRRIFDTKGVDEDIEFTAVSLRLEDTPLRHDVYYTYFGGGTYEPLVRKILTGAPFKTPFQDLDRDVTLVADRLRERLDVLVGGSEMVEQVEQVRSVFYRDTGAYLIGRIRSGPHLVPMALALVNTPEGLVVDAVLLTEDEVSILFSFARSYFHVRAACPRDLAIFLKRVLPRKRLAELYISIGYNRHGKTELYGHLAVHLQRGADRFRRARGQRGMVMTVITLPSYDIVFKIFKDEFEYPKSISEGEVRERYELVYKHDRAGRLVDAQEFEHLQLRRDHFDEDLLEELRRIAARSVHLSDGEDEEAGSEDDRVTIRHTYVQRRVTPLDLYVREAEQEKARHALVDYGNAIKDLAVTNIFTGDLLLKNFGVTRHGRVVFYDYDELCLVTDCTFRQKPQPQTHAQEMAAEPWYHVGPDDVFPEEFRSVLGLSEEQLAFFERYHSDLFEAAFWQGIQERLEAGEEFPIYPYPPRRRFPRTWDAEAELVPAGVANG